MEGLLQLVIQAERVGREAVADRLRCQMVYPVTSGSCYSERCSRMTVDFCEECGIALCRDCAEIVAFETFCQGCATVQRAFIIVLMDSLKEIEKRDRRTQC